MNLLAIDPTTTEEKHVATEETTATITMPDGQTTGPFTTDDIERAAERLRGRRQLNFDVGGATPDSASLKISGGLAIGRSLRKGEEIKVTVTDENGEVVAEGDGYIVAVSFKDKRDKYGDIESTERAHTAEIH